MINAEAELKYYIDEFYEQDEADIDAEQLIYQKALLEIDSKLQKQSKLQLKTCFTVEEAVEQLEAMVSKYDEAQEAQQDNKRLIETLMYSYDLFTEVIYGAEAQFQEDWYQQFAIQAKRLAKALENIGVNLIESTDIKFNALHHRPVGTMSELQKPQNYILKIIKPGYIYKGKVIRKAEVILNCNEER